MSVDYAVVCDICRRLRHIGQDFSSGPSFGYGSDDRAGQLAAATFAFEHASDCGEVRVVPADNAPEDYADEEEGT